jgi:hypothetical protein
MNLKQRIRVNRLRTGETQFHGESSTALEESTTVIDESNTKMDESVQFDGSSQTVEWVVPTVENEDPNKSRLRMGLRVSRLQRWWSRTKKFWKPELTPDELELQEKENHNARIRRAMTSEMKKANMLIPNAYFNLNIQYTRASKTKTEKEKITRVRFGKWLYSDDGNTIYGKVNRVPFGINPKKLVDSDVLTAIANSIGHPVGGQCSDTGAGTIIYVSLAGRNDFVDSILFREMLPKVPKDALPLTFICGATKNGGREWRTLESLPHFMGAGETGGGKTNFMHDMVCTFISRNPPSEVRLAMIDLKFGGVALNRYAGVPHLVSIVNEPKEEQEETTDDKPDEPKEPKIPDVPTGIANDIPSAVTVLRWAYFESVRRGEMFLSDKKHHPQKIDEWNRWHRSKHLPRVVIFVDELALLMDKTDVDSKHELVMIKLARYYIKSILRLARSSGIHLCGFTQSLDKSVMGVAFKTNVSGRICFSVGDATSSILVVGDGLAVNLQPAGRAIYKRGTDKFMVQTPLITEADITECVRNAKAGKQMFKFTSQAITPEDLIRFAVNEGNYMLGQTAVMEHFKNQVGFNELVQSILPDMDGKEFEVDGEIYTCIPGRGNRSRRIERKEKTI